MDYNSPVLFALAQVLSLNNSTEYSAFDLLHMHTTCHNSNFNIHFDAFTVNKLSASICTPLSYLK
jgi:hypothetical protein